MYAVPRRRRIHPAIESSGKAFSKAMHEKDYKKAAAIAFKCALEVGGVEGIINAMEDANCYIRRKSIRGGL